MSSNQTAALSKSRHSSKQHPIFQHGMVSPPPLDDDMFLSATETDTEAPPSLQTSLKALAGNKQLPPTPDSGNQAVGYIAEDAVGVAVLREMMSNCRAPQTIEDVVMTDSPAQSPVRTERPEWSSERHTSSKKQRRGSVSDSKDRSREKNKIAAAKCRQKKRDNMELIENSHRALSAENSLLRRTEQQLRATVAELRTMALDHQSCSCGVHQFNMLEAKKLAHGMSGMCSTESTLAQMRKLSESAIKSESCSGQASFHKRAHSFAGTEQFGSPREGFVAMPDGSFVEEQEFFEFDPALAETDAASS